jgi:MFS family permease
MVTERSSELAIRKVALISMLGTSIEWYDFFLYGTAAALIFPKQFFPATLSPLAGLLAAFGTFAVGFVARPVGGIVFGHWGDRLGRKKMLVAALVLMGVSTSLIGLLPGYATLGIGAPAILVALRFLQGFAIGGQWGGATLLITETAPAARRGFYGSFAQVGAPVGVLLANAIFFAFSSSLSADEFASLGWRIPFVLSLGLIGLALYVQRFLEDSEAFRQLESLRRPSQQGDHSPVLQALRRYPKEITLAAGALVANQVTFYIFVAFVIAYGASPSGLNLPRNTLLLAVLVGTLFMPPSIVVSAWISDRTASRRRVYIVGAALMVIWSFVVFPLIDTRSFLGIVAAIGIGMIFLGMMYGPQAAFTTELFATRVRYSGASLAYQAGAIIGGAFAPLISTALLAHYGTTFAVSIYMATASVVTLCSVYALRETHGTDLNSDDTLAVTTSYAGISP